MAAGPHSEGSHGSPGSEAACAITPPAPGSSPAVRSVLGDVLDSKYALEQATRDVRRAVARYADVVEDASAYVALLERLSLVEETLAHVQDDLEVRAFRKTAR